MPGRQRFAADVVGAQSPQAEWVGKALGFHSGFLGFVYNLHEGPEEYGVTWWLFLTSIVLAGAGLLAGYWLWRDGWI